MRSRRRFRVTLLDLAWLVAAIAASAARFRCLADPVVLRRHGDPSATRAAMRAQGLTFVAACFLLGFAGARSGRRGAGAAGAMAGFVIGVVLDWPGVALVMGLAATGLWGGPEASPEPAPAPPPRG